MKKKNYAKMKKEKLKRINICNFLFVQNNAYMLYQR